MVEGHAPPQGNRHAWSWGWPARIVGTIAVLLGAWPSGPACGQQASLERLLRDSPVQASAEKPRPGAVFLASALVPGGGQYMLGADRWVPYAVVEAWAWLTYVDRRGDAGSLTRRYRDLAWSVARRVSVGERRDTAFDYYETMAHFAASGSFDADLRRDGLQPDPDPSTYNGDVWLLARSLFFPNGIAYPEGSPQYARALAYYERHAIPASFGWAWGDSNLEQRVFGELIRESDAASRTATQLLGAILANHLVSAIDALVLARLQQGPGQVSARLGSGVEWEEGGRWTLRMRVTW